MLNLFLFLVKTNVSNGFLLCYFDNDYYVSSNFLNKLFFWWREEQIDKNFLFSSMLHKRILRSEKLTSNEKRYHLIKKSKIHKSFDNSSSSTKLIFFKNLSFLAVSSRLAIIKIVLLSMYVEAIAKRRENVFERKFFQRNDDDDKSFVVVALLQTKCNSKSLFTIDLYAKFLFFFLSKNSILWILRL